MGIELKPNGITKAHLERANIGQDYWEQDFSNFKGPDKARKAAITYLQRLEDMKDQGVGMLFVGPNGPGKTTLMMIIAKYLSRARWDVFCTSLGEIVADIQRGFKSGSEHQGDDQEGLQTRAKTANFLFIDDVGKEHRGQSGFVSTVFDNLIRFRVQHRLPTFLTTNYTKSELEGTYGESVMSLLEGKLLAVVVDGSDYRRTELKQKVKNGFKSS